MDTEGIAVRAVEDRLSSLQTVKPFLDKNDRTPLVDGTIAVYSSPSHSNADLVGKITVQVKGKGVQSFNKLKEKEPYSLSRDTLKGYLLSNGVLFFLVFINKKKPRKRTVYYTLLNPFKIQKILEGMSDEQKSVSVYLEKFPQKDRDIGARLALAIQTQAERPEQGFDDSLLRNATAFKIYSDRNVSFEQPIILDYKEMDYSFVLETASGMAVPVPGKLAIYPAEYTEQPTEATFRSGEFTFQNPAVKRLDVARVEFTLSQGLRLEIPKPGSEARGAIHLSMQDSLALRYKDVGFFLTSVDTGCFEMDGESFQFDGAALEPGEGLREHFDYMGRLIELLIELDINPALIKMSEIDENRSVQLGRLYKAIIEQQEFAADYESPGRVRQPIGPWYIELMCVQSNSEGMWKFHGLFSKELAPQFFWSSDEEEADQKVVRMSPYDLIDEERLPYTLNLNLERLVPSYEEISEYPDTYARANLMVIRLIKAADTVPARFEEFMSAAEALNSWLIESDGALAPHLINRWQILERRNLLTTSELTEIRRLRREAMRNANNQVAFCCSVLLKDFDEADDAYHALTEHDQTTVRQWPIWTLHHHKDALDEVTETS